MVCQVKGNLPGRIKMGMAGDPTAQDLLKLASEAKTRRFWLKDGLLYTKGNRVYISRWDNLRKELLKEYHGTKWTGHPSQWRTLAFLEAAYFLPKM